MCKNHFILIVLTFTLCGCYFIDSYNGDGVLIDNGYSLKGGRYTLKLLEVPLDQPKKYKFKIYHLVMNLQWV